MSQSKFINWFFITIMQSVYRAVRTEYLNIFQVKCIFNGLNIASFYLDLQ